MDIEPTPQELNDVRLCAQKLWDLDTNKLEPEQHYGIDIQHGKRCFQDGDVAEGKLFRGVSRSVWQRPTYRTFFNLLDNYERKTGVEETMTAQERQENIAFITAIMETKPMQYIHKYLVAKGLVSDNVLEFKQKLYELWFKFYRRDGRNDSSGFEHVFVGESDENQISGFHNWIQFFIEESKGSLDYRGYVYPKKRTQPPDVYERLLGVQLAWDGEIKRVSTMFIGSSPEFEMALYTLYFLAGELKNFVNLLNYEVKITCHKICGHLIGTCFPEIVDEH
eukprot:g6879.t1